MSLDTIKTEIQNLTPHEWGEIFSWVIGTERARRDQDTTRATVIVELQDEGTIPTPAASTASEAEASGTAPEWVTPGTDHTRMYRQGAVVAHNGKMWKSITATLNCWEPGMENGLTWREIVPTPPPSEAPTAPPEFVQPTGAHDVYPLGAQVTYNGHVYEATIDANAYSPDAYPAGWKQIN